MFVLYSRNTVIRAYFDKYVDRATGALLKEVAAALGYTTKNISDAVFQRGSVTVVVEYIRMAPSRYHSTDSHVPGWDSEAAERVLEDHLSGLYRIEGVESRAKADKAPRAPYRSRRAIRPGAEDWSQYRFWKAVLDALYELVALTKGGARRVEDIKAKLVEHRVPNLDDRLGPTLRTIANRLGWVADIGGDPNRWYLTPEYNRLSDEDRATVLAEWNDDGSPVVVATIGPPEPEAPYGAEPSSLALPGRDPVLVGSHRYVIDGEAFGLASGARASIEVDVPLDIPYKEHLALQQFILTVREALLKLV
jgi:hypothetical protein